MVHKQPSTSTTFLDYDFLNVPYIVVDTYTKGRPVRLGHILVKLKRERLVKHCLLSARASGNNNLTTVIDSEFSFQLVEMTLFKFPSSDESK